jgi:hypothetical protein
MEMDRERRRLFSSGRDPQFLVMMNADSGKIIQSLPIGAGVDGSVYEAGTALLFVSTRDGKAHIFHEDSPDKLTEVETLKNRVWRWHDRYRSEDSQSFSDHRGFWPCSCCSNERKSRGGTKTHSWHVSGANLWALEKSSSRTRRLMTPLPCPNDVNNSSVAYPGFIFAKCV